MINFLSFIFSISSLPVFFKVIPLSIIALKIVVALSRTLRRQQKVFCYFSLSPIRATKIIISIFGLRYRIEGMNQFTKPIQKIKIKSENFWMAKVTANNFGGTNFFFLWIVREIIETATFDRFAQDSQKICGIATIDVEQLGV